ncbi:hypothetical protein [Hansschlegelia zhihuaiae]|uniref:Uncharacterized protein n=1 Tax=Hansschlegelia zhihuaiae TaxID=405005 RepID=A0A4Q0MMR2_9HYPH|nr:hypothetical protein [Hansschlegelia zhihuaiae]RXF74359.1 hypothetical protein EK403_05920 [Hansschlegelia zhihuaiae]
MRKMLLAASILSLAAGGAMAQTTPSTSDKPGAAGQNSTTDPKQTSPGATGAMQNEAGGVATSPQDVQKQGTGATTPQAKGDSGAAGKTTGGGGDEKPK